MNPPSNNSIRGLPYDCATVLLSSIPNNGNAAMGIKELTGMGNFSVTHKLAVSRVMNKVCDSFNVKLDE
jgi:hypothetical protein